MTIDHILPRSLGGEHSYANTQPAHRLCNHVKGNTHEEEIDFDEFKAELRKRRMKRTKARYYNTTGRKVRPLLH